MKDLKEKYSLLTAVTMVVGIVIGIGIFFKISSIMVIVNGDANIAITSWVIGAVLIILSAITFAKLASKISDNGGLQAFITHVFGKPLGYVVGFFQSFIYFPTLIAGISLLASMFTGELFNYNTTDNAFLVLLIAFLYALIFITLNIVSTHGGKFQSVSTFIKLVPILVIIFAGIFLGSNASDSYFAENFAPAVANSDSFMSLVGKALIPILFAFDGFIVVTTMSKEIKNSKRNLPLAITLGVAFIGVAYILFNIALLNVAPGFAYADGFSLFNAISLMFNDNVAKLLNIFIIVSALGVLNGMIMASFRAPQAFADKFHFPKMEKIKELDHNNIPRNSAYLISGIVFVLFVSVLLGLMFSNNQALTFDYFVGLLTDGPVAFMWVSYVLIFVGTVISILSKKLDLGIPILITASISAIIGTFAVLKNLESNPSYVIITLLIVFISISFASKSKSFE